MTYNFFYYKFFDGSSVRPKRNFPFEFFTKVKETDTGKI